MIATGKLVCRYAAWFVTAAIVTWLYTFTRPPVLAQDQRIALASRFQFTRMIFPQLSGVPLKSVRAVHPSLERISAWISSVGAAVALADLDGDGLPNDLCHVDPRTDLVVIAPVPGTGARYRPFALDPAPLRYDITMAPMGCLAGDMNADGLMDLLVYYWGRTPIAFLRTADSRHSVLGAESYRPIEVIPGGERWFTNAATFADVDGDDYADLIIGNYFQDGSRILDPYAAGIEVLHDTKSRSFNGGKNRILLWESGTSGSEPDVRFRDVQGVFSEEVARGWTLAIGAADLDGDLLPEIYFANDSGPDRLLHNQSTPGRPRFILLEGQRTPTTPKSFILGHDSFKGMGVDFGDLNGDGLLDIYVSNIATEFGLQESHFVWLSTGQLGLIQKGIAPYIQGSERLGLSRSGWGWESRLADFDNDSVLEAIQATGFVKGRVNRWPELQSLGTSNDQIMHDPRFWPRFQPGDDLSGHEPNAFFVRAWDGRYYDIAKEIGLGEPMVSRGIATADVDGDGDLDFAVANQWEPSYFYCNDSPHTGAFLGLHLMLPLRPLNFSVRQGHPSLDTPVRAAIGAEATVYLPDGRRLVAQVDGGNGHSGKRSPDLHFGLGPLDLATNLRVDLRWRDPTGQMHQATLYLQPGWHTVLLGWSSVRR